MKKSNLFKSAALPVVAILALSACKQADAPAGEGNRVSAESEAAPEKAAWGYGEADGPAKWGDLSADYATCKTGKEQSPIDLPAATAAKTIDVATNYAPTEAEVLNNGHAIEAKFGEGFTLTSGDKTYKLLQFHFHTPSENTIQGKASPADVHFVHADDAGNLAVLGIMINEGAANPQFQAVLDSVGKKTPLDIKAMLPASMTAYNFKGSLTTPPCSEGVNWHVLTTPITASKEQIAALNKLTGSNARPVQPMNDRAI
ncbi:carbonic anhydrase [Sphingorhabdus arenilitoris]|uniref:carbonic anhydrase n=1 Tax=Sphingorhabdus arenilitoris TaxID=1490041 RepID=A0ABV8RIP9_9SPHN